MQDWKRQRNMSLDLKKKQLELMKVKVARHELELRVEERLEEIQRLKDHIKIQEEAEIRLNNELNQMNKGK